MNPTFQHDVLVIGSGAAGLTVALKLGDSLNVAVLCKDQVFGGSTYYAQGGVAAVLDSTDTVDAHVRDTLTAGAGLCVENAVRFTVERSKRSIEWLIQQGVPFTENEDTETEYHLTKEG